MTDGEKIHLNEYKETKSADRLDEIAIKLSQSAQKIEQSKFLLAKKWEGNSALAYIAKMNRLEESIRMSSHQIRKASEQLHLIVEQTRQAEAKAEEIAQTRNQE